MPLLRDLLPISSDSVPFDWQDPNVSREDNLELLPENKLTRGTVS